MTDVQMPLFGPGSRGGVDTVAQRHRPPPVAATGKPIWVHLTLKHPPACSACVRSLHKTWGDCRTPYRPPVRASWRRTLDGDVTFWCNEHADGQKMKETADAAEAAKAALPKPAPRRYRRK